MSIFQVWFLVYLGFLQHSKSEVLANIFEDDECVLDPKLVNEIASYENVTKYIMREILNSSGELMYQQYTEFIDKFGARPSGSEVLERAIDHMINLTYHNGVYNVTTEDVEVPYWKRISESAHMLSPRPKEIQLLGLGSSVSTPPEGITAEVIVVRSFEEFDTIKESSVRGRIVLFDPHFTNYGDTVVYRTQSASIAAKKNALAVLVRSITPFSLYTPHTGQQFYEENVTKIPVAAITLEDADLMRRLYDRGQRILVKLTMINTHEIKKSRNTLIDLKGRMYPEKMVIVSGHIDSWDVGQGAMDDGGGMMISWFAPIILNFFKLQPRRTIRSILWTAEEAGLIGAQSYFKTHIDELQNINFIMESDEGTFKPLGLEVGATPEARCVIAEILKLYGKKIRASDSPGSDIAMFVERGVPGASLLNANDRYFWFHHTEADTIDVQNKDDVIECAAFWATISFIIADLSIDIPRL